MMIDLKDWLILNYNVLKALHIISLIALMAGLLYLPRLFVYHVEAKPYGELSETLKIMERRLLKIIINPSLIFTFVFGLILLMTPGLVDMKAGWLHGKLFAVFLLTAYHGMMIRWYKDFQNDRNTRSQKFYRIMNEVPAILMILIVLLVVTKPF